MNRLYESIYILDMISSLQIDHHRRRPKNHQHRISRLAQHWVCAVLISFSLLKESSSLSVSLKSNRRDNSSGSVVDRSHCSHGGKHICLFDNYDTIRGPYFSALMDQLMGETQHLTKNLAYFTSKYDLKQQQHDDENEDSEDHDGGHNDLMQILSVSLDLYAANLFLLDEWNPLTLSERLTTLQPTMVWIQGRNAFHTRHLLRTSGLDRWLQEHCTPLAQQKQDENVSISQTGDGAVLFVGEGAGAVCAASSMDVAYVKGDDPTMSPELQMCGLDMLGDDDNEYLVTFGLEQKQLEEHSRTKHNIYDLANIQICQNDQIFVWSQSPVQTPATSFVMTPRRRGMIERYTSPDPWLDRRYRCSSQSKDGGDGVACYGEPSIDPSRSMHMIGDSEWIEEYL